MLENILYTLPEIFLVLGVLLLSVGKALFQIGQKSCFKIAKISIFLSAAFAVLFYNKGILSEYFSVSTFGTLSYFITSCMAYAWLQLSSKWFYAQKDISAFSFCILSLILVFLLDIIIKTNHFFVLWFALLGLCLFQYLLFRYSQTSESLYHTSGRYGLTALMFCLFMGVTVFLLPPMYRNYMQAGEFILIQPYFMQVIMVLGVLCFLLFMIGAAPFHFWFADSISPVLLPVATYFNIVPILALWSVFLKLNSQFFIYFEENLKIMYIVFGILSLIIAAIGANASRFLRKIFAFGGLYHIGVMLMILSSFNANISNVAFIYIELFVFFMLGVYVCFHGMRYKGEYINNLSLVSGIGSKRIYVSAVFLLLIVSLAALPPLTGFLVQTQVLLSIAQKEWFIYVILLGLWTILPAYLRIIEVMYFAKKEHEFDRVDPSIYIYLLVYVLLLIMLFIKPQFFLRQSDILMSLG